MAERSIAHTKEVIHAEHARAIANLMESLDPNQTGNPTRAKDPQDILRPLNKAESLGVSLDEQVDQIDLLDCRPESL